MSPPSEVRLTCHVAGLCQCPACGTLTAFKATTAKLLEDGGVFCPQCKVLCVHTWGPVDVLIQGVAS